jgi:hypothetical protein
MLSLKPDHFDKIAIFAKQQICNEKKVYVSENLYTNIEIDFNLIYEEILKNMK